ncbi:MAG: DUF58 domain-containing protein, partial [Phycisphaerae bacterium]
SRGSRYGVRLTLKGVGFCGAILLTTFVALQQSGNTLVLLLGMFGGALLLNFFSGWWSFRRVTVERVLPQAVVAGSPNVLQYRFRSHRRWGRCYALRVSDETVTEPGGHRRTVEACAPVLRPGREVTVSVPVVWSHRGSIQFERLVVTTSFPFGLIRKYWSVHRPESLIAYPPLGRIRTSVWNLTRRAEARSTGDGASNRSGGDQEFFGLRRYRPGDNPRRIHWRRSARTGEIFVREMTRPRLNQLWCILNTQCSPADIDAGRRAEAAFSCAATVICDVLEHGGKVGLIANGTPVLASPPGSGRDLRGRLLRELATRPMNADEPLHAALTRMNWRSRWRAPCFLIAPALNDDVQRSAQWLKRFVGQVTVLAPGTPAFEALFSSRTSRLDFWKDLGALERPYAPRPAREAAA